MKFILLLLTLSFSIFACGTNEAQFIATVTEVETDSLTYCRAKVSYESITYFSGHFFCPLSRADLIELGVSLPLINGHDCEISVGDQISGIAVMEGQQIYLD